LGHQVTLWIMVKFVRRGVYRLTCRRQTVDTTLGKICFDCFVFVLRTSLRGYSGNDSCRMMRGHRKMATTRPASWTLRQRHILNRLPYSLVLGEGTAQRDKNFDTRASLNKLTRLPTTDLDIFQTTPVSPTFRMPCSLDCSTSKLSDRFEEPIGLSNQVAAYTEIFTEYCLPYARLLNLMSSRRRLRQLANQKKSYRIDRPTTLVNHLVVRSTWMTQERVAGRSSALHKTKEISFDTAQIHAFSQIRSCQITFFPCLWLVLQPVWGTMLMAES